MELIPLSKVKADGAVFVLKNFIPIPKNAVTLLSASGGTGKTRLSLIMADKFIKEFDYKVNVALWLTEDYQGQVRNTFDEMIKHNLVSEKSLDNMLLILDEPPQLAKRENGLFKANYEGIKEIGNSLIKANVHFAIFDPLLAFYGGNENDNSEARVFIQSFAEWAKNAEITTLIIHHSNKEGGSRGATAFHDGVRARYEIDYIRNEKGEIRKDKMHDGLRVVRIKKDNWGARMHLYKISDGEDEIVHKIMPPMNIKQPVITTFNEEDDKTDIPWI